MPKRPRARHPAPPTAACKRRAATSRCRQRDLVLERVICPNDTECAALRELYTVLQRAWAAALSADELSPEVPRLLASVRRVTVDLSGAYTQRRVLTRPDDDDHRCLVSATPTEIALCQATALRVLLHPGIPHACIRFLCSSAPSTSSIPMRLVHYGLLALSSLAAGDAEGAHELLLSSYHAARTDVALAVLLGRTVTP